MNDTVTDGAGNAQAAMKYIQRTPLENLAPIFTVLVKRLYKHRQRDQGFTPKSIFEQCVGLSGMSVSVQTVHQIVDGKGKPVGFALRQRDVDESGDAWAGLFHSTCTSARLTDTPRSLLTRNKCQAEGLLFDQEDPQFIGVTIHDEPERWSACLTVMFLRQITFSQMKNFYGVWRIFSNIHDPQIIDHNRYLLEWVSDPNRPVFVDVRKGWKPAQVPPN